MVFKSKFSKNKKSPTNLKNGKIKFSWKGLKKEPTSPKTSSPCKKRWRPATAIMIKKKRFSLLSFLWLIKTINKSSSNRNPTKKDKKSNTIWFGLFFLNERNRTETKHPTQKHVAKISKGIHHGQTSPSFSKLPSSVYQVHKSVQIYFFMSVIKKNESYYEAIRIKK